MRFTKFRPKTIFHPTSDGFSPRDTSTKAHNVIHYVVPHMQFSNLVYSTSSKILGGGLRATIVGAPPGSSVPPEGSSVIGFILPPAIDSGLIGRNKGV